MSFFYALTISRYGKFVATHPKKVMAVAFFFVILGSLGLINFKWVLKETLSFSNSCKITQSVNRSEADANRLLYPQDSDFVLNKEWRNEHYEDNLRLQYAMLSHDSNVLTKNGVLKV